MRRLISLFSVMAVVGALLFASAGAASAKPGPGEDEGGGDSIEQLIDQLASAKTAPLQPSNRLTECPQAGLKDRNPAPLDKRTIDAVEQISNQGDDIRLNQDYSCFPQNETSIDVNPKAPRNVVGGQNDYRLAWGTSGFGASSTSGKTWYDGITPFPSPGNPLLSPALLSDDHIDGGGDPVIVFDRDGIAYYAQIHFERERGDNGVFVQRSTNGGFTWSRPCVPIDSTSDPTDDEAVCGGPGDPRQPNDGVVWYERDPDGTGPLDAAAIHDKEWMAAGPRPAGVEPQCFGPETHNVVMCEPDVIGVDRLYVTWTRFDTTAPTAEIVMSYSDDQGRSWAPFKIISGNAPFCSAQVVPQDCDYNQGSVPTVHPKTGYLYVSFENYNTPDENQYLMVRSKDGGQTFEGPFFITPVFDRNYPNSGASDDRPDCNARGQQSGRPVLTNSCFRVSSWANMVVDKRGGLAATLDQPGNSQFADDLYMVMSDNRNGTNASSNVDVFLFKSTDGGMNWLGPTRVNNDRSLLTEDRDCVEGDEGCTIGNFGNDQWFPWIDINNDGNLNVVFHDRRKDKTSTRIEWPTSRQRPGNYLAWFFGAQCTAEKTGPITSAAGRQCTSKNAQVIPQPTSPMDVGPGLQPGQDTATLSFVGPFRNFQISDVPFNLDYSFRAGLFMGDYNNVTVQGDTAYALWTDARNGRSSRKQDGRNPICEQSDVFVDAYSASNANTNPLGNVDQTPFERTSCPKTAVDRRGDDDDVHDDD